MFQGQLNLDAAVAAEGADGDVLFELGMLHASGRQGAVDLIAAHKWFNLAALKGRQDAIAMRREIAEVMSEADIAAAQREARAWMTAH
jgi:TPR repeat protein